MDVKSKLFKLSKAFLSTILLFVLTIGVLIFLIIIYNFLTNYFNGFDAFMLEATSICFLVLFIAVYDDLDDSEYDAMRSTRKSFLDKKEELYSMHDEFIKNEVNEVNRKNWEKCVPYFSEYITNRDDKQLLLEDKHLFNSTNSYFLRRIDVCDEYKDMLIKSIRKFNVYNFIDEITDSEGKFEGVYIGLTNFGYLTISKDKVSWHLVQKTPNSECGIKFDDESNKLINKDEIIKSIKVTKLLLK